MLEVRVDRGRCQGAGECVWHAPNSFTIDETIRSVPASPPGDDEETLLAAARGCPNMAITVFRDGVMISS